MTSPLPPKRRDTRSPWDLLRQDRTNLRQLNNGLIGGRAPMLRPLPGPLADGDDFDDDAGDDDTDQLAARNTDRAVCMVAGQVTLPLTYEPLDGSLHVRWDGEDLDPTEWAQAGQLVTFTDRHIHVGDVLTAAYLYYPSDVPEPVITSPTEGSSTSDTTPTITGTAPAGWSVEVFVDGVSVGTTTATTTGTWSVTSGALALGAHTVTATATSGDTSADAEAVDFSVTGVSAATATLRGFSVASGGPSGGGGLSSLALPTGTAVGDLIAVQVNGDQVTVSDPRLTAVGGMWIGWATDLSDIAASASGAHFWAITCITLNTNAVAWTAAVQTSDTSMDASKTLPIPGVSGVGAAVCGIVDSHSFVTGNCGVPPGYTPGGASPTAIVHSRVDFWTSGTIGTSPTSPTTFTGGPGAAFATVVGLIGP